MPVIRVPTHAIAAAPAKNDAMATVNDTRAACGRVRRAERGGRGTTGA